MNYIQKDAQYKLPKSLRVDQDENLRSSLCAIKRRPRNGFWVFAREKTSSIVWRRLGIVDFGSNLG